MVDEIGGDRHDSPSQWKNDPLLVDDVPPERCTAYHILHATPHRVPRPILLIMVLAVLATNCEPATRLDIVSPRRGEVVAGRAVTVVWRPVQEESAARDHYHVLLDRDLPALGEPIPLDDPRVVHLMGVTMYTFTDVEPGIHRVTIVMGDATHRARGGLYRASVPFRTRDPHLSYPQNETDAIHSE
jgi:hypothetical protein